MAKKVTMDVLAKHLGLSKFAISKALSGKSGVSQHTRERVIQAASQLGYRAAGSMSAHKTAGGPAETPVKPVVVVMMPNIRNQTIDSVYWGRILEEISAELEKKGAGMIIVTDFSREHFLNFINPQGLVGVICVGVMSTSLLLEMRQLHIPFVLVDHEDELVPADSIFINNMDCQARLTHYLVGLGHSALQFVGHTSFSRSFYDRWLGFRSALEKHGIPVTEQTVLPLAEIDTYSNMMAIKLWIQEQAAKHQLPTALVCANDAIAISALQALEALHIKVPLEVSVCGFDNIDDAMNVQPGLTTMNVDKQAMGRRAVEALYRRIEHKNDLYEKLLLSADLVIRDSTSQPLKRSV